MDNSDLPLKQYEQSVFLLPVICDSMALPLPGTSGRTFVDAIRSYSTVDQSGVSVSVVEPSSPTLPSIEHTRSVADEMKNGRYRDPALSLVKFSNNRDMQHSRKGLWSHLYQLGGGSKHKVGHGVSLLQAKDNLMVNTRENFGRDDANTWHLQHLKPKHIDETGRVSVDIMDEKNKNPEKKLLPQDARLKILSTSSFSHFFGKKAPKGKGAVDVNLGDKTQFDSGAALQSDGSLFPRSGVISSARVQLSQHCKSGVALESTCAGVSLREWLKPRKFMKTKVERLNIFCQIVELVSLAHSQGAALHQLYPSYFIVLPSDKVEFIGSSTRTDMDVPMLKTTRKKRSAEEAVESLCTSNTRQQKLITDAKFKNYFYSATSNIGTRTVSIEETSHSAGCSSGSESTEHKVLSMVHSQTTVVEKALVTDRQLEEKWYACPEDLDGNVCKLSSNIYCLGVLLFELMCSFDSLEEHSAAMFDMHHRILPPSFLSANPKEAGFCLWLIHPDSLARPTIRDILISDLFRGFQEFQPSDELTIFGDDHDSGELELLLDFLVSSKEKKQGHAMKLIEDINCIEADIKGVETKVLSTSSKVHVKRDYSLQDFLKSVAQSGRDEARLMTDMSQLEKAYFSMRSQSTAPAAVGRADKDLLKNREISSQMQKQLNIVSMEQKSAGGLDVFFEGLCKFSRFSKFKLCGTLRNCDLLNSANVICSLSFDRDEEFIAVAGASKRIKIFDFSALMNDTIDIHYPVIEMGNKSKLSCVSWNSYIKNYMASTDYDGVVQVWDASTGLGLSQYLEHQKRAWSVDFSKVDPTKFATGSDDCSVKLWCTNEKRSTSTIWSPANVCCVQFSPYSSHLLAFGSADHRIYGYDLRYTRIPWCSLAGHERTVSYAKFVDAETLVSASTDNTLKLWDLSKTSLSGISHDACHLSFTGHTNKKHFVGLSTRDGYITCGSESNEVFTYYRSLPMPVTSYKFSPIVSQSDAGDDSGFFVSSVCWRSKSNTVLAANSGGSIRLLQLV